MNNEVIYRGLRLVSSRCRYFQVIEGKIDSIVENIPSSTLILTYSPGSTSESLSLNLGLELVGGSNMEMISMPKPSKFIKPIISLNGFKFEKLTHDTHILNIIIVGDTDSRVSQGYSHTTIVVSDKDYKDPEFINYLFFSGNLLYLRPYGPRPSCFEIKNFPKFTLQNENLDLESTSETIYFLRRKYDEYVIRAIDYQDQFIGEIRNILGKYGVELVRINKETDLHKTSHVIYQFTQTPMKYNHPGYGDDERYIMRHRLPVEFTLRATDMVMYFDFKNRYNNVNLLTDFCEFKTTDKYGERWTAAIKWGQITEEFNHIYQPDDNSNFSNQCQFRCELFFFEVLDDRYNFLQEIILKIENLDKE